MEHLRVSELLQLFQLQSAAAVVVAGGEFKHQK